LCQVSPVTTHTNRVEHSGIGSGAFNTTVAPPMGLEQRRTPSSDNLMHLSKWLRELYSLWYFKF